jgi:hypothetical protein
MTKLQLFGKWTLLVWLNAAFSFVFAVSAGFDSAQEITGIVLGVFTFVALYSCIDFRLLQQNKDSLRTWLLIGVLIKVATQFVPAIQVTTGIIAVSCIQAVFKQVSTEAISNSPRPFELSDANSFIASYSATVIDGVLLSIVVGLFVLIIKLVATKLIPYFKTSQKNG